MSLEDVKRFKVLPLDAPEFPGGMESIALYGPDGEVLRTVELRTPENRSFAWNDDFSGFVITGNAPDDDAEFYMRTDPDSNAYFNIYGNAAGTTIWASSKISIQVPVLMESPILRSPNGSQHRLVVDNSGVLSTVPATVEDDGSVTF